ELLLEILAYLPITSILSVAETSKSLNWAVMNDRCFNSLVRDCVFTGDLFWILPIDSVRGEVESAHRSAWAWIPDERPDYSKSPFKAYSFPFYAFLRACFESDSMMSRRRRWYIAKQFDGLWKRYRSRGWDNPPKAWLKGRIKMDPTRRVTR